MPKKIKGKKVFPKLFGITERDIQMLDELLAAGNFLSESDVIRHCIRIAHKSHFPYFKQKDMEQYDKQQKQKSIKSLPIEEYAKTIFGDDIIIKPEKEIILTHRQKPGINATVEWDYVKRYKSRNEVWRKAKRPLEDE